MEKTINWSMKGNIFNIQRFSLHDGEGIRTIVFMKGCGLRCKWCSNPESQEPGKQLIYNYRNCIMCQSCIDVCKSGALSIDKDKIKVDRKRCVLCGACADICCAEAIELAGRNVSVKDVFDEIIKDRNFYSYSKGGITLSGGEALLQPTFSREILKAGKLNGLNTAVETAGFVSGKAIDEVIEYVDTFLYDIKTTDEMLHIKYTGQSNVQIIDNLKYIARSPKELIIRIPLIPGINDSLENIRSTAALAKSLHNVKEIHLLPYHRLGINKYEFLGRGYELSDLKIPENTKLEELKKEIQSRGLACRIGG